jgi:tetratricopeptide (TPR) repeat protein
MQVFRERFILTILASFFVLLAVTNPLGFGGTARIIDIMIIVVMAGIAASPSTTIIWILEYAKDIPRIRLSPDKFVILIARLDGDDPKGTHTRAVARAFLGQQGVQRTQTRRVLRLSEDSDAEGHAVRIGRRWLARRKADLLIWGEVLQKEKFLNLWFTTKDATSDFQQSRFPLEANLLDGNFTEVANAQLISISLSAIKPATEVAERSLRDILRPVAGRLRNLLNNSDQFTLRQGSDLRFALGVALCAIAREEGGAADLQEAVNLLGSSLRDIDRTRESLAWANVQHYRGVALADLGAEALSSEILDDALAAFRSALDERPKERVPLDWARTQHSLGGALIDLGMWKPERGYLIEAIAAFDAALSERRRDHTPTEWAVTTNARALAVQRLAQWENNGITKINEAIELFRQALEATSASTTPILWGGIKLNRGLAFLELADRQPGRDALDDALSECRGVLSVWTREEVPKLWVKAQFTIGRVLTQLGELENSTEQLKEAEDVLRAALEICTRKFSSPLWAVLQVTLGNTLVKIAEAEIGFFQSPLQSQIIRIDPQKPQPTQWVPRQQELISGIQRIQRRDSALSHLEEAVSAFRNGLNEIPRERFPGLWAETQYNFASALVRLGEQEEEREYLLEALCRVNLALEVWTYEQFPWSWSLAQGALGMIFTRLGEREEEPGMISRFESAVSACRKLLQVRTQEHAPLEWARNQNRLGIALYRLGDAKDDLATLNESVSAYSSAREVLRTLSIRESEEAERNLHIVQVKIQSMS